MPETSEYGDIIINAHVDEWGKRRINGLLEDGVRVVATIVGVFKQWSQKGYVTHVYLCYKTIRLTQTLKKFGRWVLPVPTILKYWAATLQAVHVSSCPIRIIRLSTVLPLSHSFSRPSRLLSLLERVGLLHEFYAGKPSAKKTKLFLVLGDLAIQLSND